MNGHALLGTMAVQMKVRYPGWSLRRRLMLAVLGLLLFSLTARVYSEDLTLTNGTVYKNVTVTKVDPDGLRIIHSDGGGKVLFTQLPEAIQQKYHYDAAAAQKYTEEQEAKKRAELDRVLQQSAASQSAAPAANSVSTAKKPVVKSLPDSIYPMVKGKLDWFDGTALQRFDDAKLSAVRYYAVYYSAHWCGPCRRFTPDLVKFYNEFKPSHPNFELIFVSLDEDEQNLTEYMKSVSMPWPTVHFSALDHDSQGHLTNAGIQQFAGNGIPDLVLIDSATGTVISDSYQGQHYLGPQKVLKDIPEMVR